MRLGLNLTDAFCGFKAYRVPALACLDLTEPVMQCRWSCGCKRPSAAMRIVELPAPLIYLDEKRSFGGSLDDWQDFSHYHEVIERSGARFAPGEHTCDRERQPLVASPRFCGRLAWF